MKKSRSDRRRKLVMPARGASVAGDPAQPGRIRRWVRFFTHDLWHIELGNLSSFSAWGTRCSRVLVITARDFIRDRCMQQAAALTYLTIFTLPALLALVFSVAKALNAFEQLRTRVIEPFLANAFPQDGDKGSQQIHDLVSQVFGVVEEADLSVLGGAGVLFLVYAALKMLAAVERSFNEIWGVQRSRSLVRKFSDYLAIVAVVPIALLAGTALTGVLRAGILTSSSDEVATSAVEAEVSGQALPRDAQPGAVEKSSDPGAPSGPSLPSEDPGAGAASTGAPSKSGSVDLEKPRAGDSSSVKAGSSSLLAASLPLVVICAGMTLLLFTLPNTRVRFFPALIGGVVAGLIWQTAQMAFVEFQITLTNKNPIFSSFAVVPVLLSWIYLSWITVFIGAELSFAVQNEGAMTSMARTGEVDQRFRDALAARLAGRVAAAFLRGEAAPSAAEMGLELQVPPRSVRACMEALCAARLLVEVGDAEELRFVPARDPDTITLFDVIDSQRRVPGVTPPATRSRLDERIDRVLEGFDRCQRSATENHTLRELALASAEEPDREPIEGPVGSLQPLEDPLA